MSGLLVLDRVAVWAAAVADYASLRCKMMRRTRISFDLE